MDRIIAVDHFSEKDAAAVTSDVSAGGLGGVWVAIARISTFLCSLLERQEIRCPGLLEIFGDYVSRLLSPGEAPLSTELVFMISKMLITTHIDTRAYVHRFDTTITLVHLSH